MSKLFKEKTYKALRKIVRKDLEPMKKAMFEYHLEKIRRKEKWQKKYSNERSRT